MFHFRNLTEIYLTWPLSWDFGLAEKYSCSLNPAHFTLFESLFLSVFQNFFQYSSISMPWGALDCTWPLIPAPQEPSKIPREFGADSFLPILKAGCLPPFLEKISSVTCTKLNPERSARRFWPWNSSEQSILQFTIEVMGESQGNIGNQNCSPSSCLPLKPLHRWFMKCHFSRERTVLRGTKLYVFNKAKRKKYFQKQSC